MYPLLIILHIRNKESLDVSLMEDDDSDYDWHYTWDMSGGVVSTHFQEGTVSVICACLAARFGGEYDDYYAAACGIAGWAAESSSDVWEKTDYYWTANPDSSSEFPYYIKQVIRYYSDAECNNYIDTSVRYYYSDMTF